MGVAQQARVTGLAPWAGGRVKTPVNCTFYPQSSASSCNSRLFHGVSGSRDHIINPHVAGVGSVIPTSFSRIKARLLTQELVTIPDLFLRFFPKQAMFFSVSAMYKTHL